MRQVQPGPQWPESWTTSFAYDRQELWGEMRSPGYVHAYRQRRDFVLQSVQDLADPGARVLDVAAAQGNFSLALAELGYRVTWNDLRDDLIGYVQLKHESGDIEFMPGNIFERQAETHYHVVLATEVIEHVAHPDEFLRQISRWIQPGGFLILTTPNGEYIRNRLPAYSGYASTRHLESVQFKPDADGHLFLLTEDELRGFAAGAGLELLEYRTFNAFFSAGYLKTAWLLKRIPFAWIGRLEQLSMLLPGFVRRRIHTSIGMVVRRPA